VSLSTWNVLADLSLFMSSILRLRPAVFFTPRLMRDLAAASGSNIFFKVAEGQHERKLDGSEKGFLRKHRRKGREGGIQWATLTMLVTEEDPLNRLALIMYRVDFVLTLLPCSLTCMVCFFLLSVRLPRTRSRATV